MKSISNNEGMSACPKISSKPNLIKYTSFEIFSALVQPFGIPDHLEISKNSHKNSSRNSIKQKQSEFLKSNEIEQKSKTNLKSDKSFSEIPDKSSKNASFTVSQAHPIIFKDSNSKTQSGCFYDPLNKDFEVVGPDKNNPKTSDHFYKSYNSKSPLNNPNSFNTNKNKFVNKSCVSKSKLSQKSSTEINEQLYREEFKHGNFATENFDKSKQVLIQKLEKRRSLKNKIVNFADRNKTHLDTFPKQGLSAQSQPNSLKKEVIISQKWDFSTPFLVLENQNKLKNKENQFFSSGFLFEVKNKQNKGVFGSTPLVLLNNNFLKPVTENSQVIKTGVKKQTIQDLVNLLPENQENLKIEFAEKVNSNFEKLKLKKSSSNFYTSAKIPNNTVFSLINQKNKTYSKIHFNKSFKDSLLAEPENETFTPFMNSPFLNSGDNTKSKELSSIKSKTKLAKKSKDLFENLNNPKIPNGVLKEIKKDLRLAKKSVLKDDSQKDFGGKFSSTFLKEIQQKFNTGFRSGIYLERDLSGLKPENNRHAQSTFLMKLHVKK